MTNCKFGRNSQMKSLIFSCSGASEFGELTDKLTRKLKDGGLGKMSCIAGFEGIGESFIKESTDARSILVIDGCGLHCGKKCLEKNRLLVKNHIVVSDYQKSEDNNANVFNNAYQICEGILNR